MLVLFLLFVSALCEELPFMYLFWIDADGNSTSNCTLDNFCSFDRAIELYSTKTNLSYVEFNFNPGTYSIVKKTIESFSNEFFIQRTHGTIGTITFLDASDTTESAFFIGRYENASITISHVNFESLNRPLISEDSSFGMYSVSYSKFHNVHAPIFRLNQPLYNSHYDLTLMQVTIEQLYACVFYADLTGEASILNAQLQTVSLSQVHISPGRRVIDVHSDGFVNVYMNNVIGNNIVGGLPECFRIHSERDVETFISNIKFTDVHKCTLFHFNSTEGNIRVGIDYAIFDNVGSSKYSPNILFSNPGKSNVDIYHAIFKNTDAAAFELDFQEPISSKETDISLILGYSNFTNLNLKDIASEDRGGIVNIHVGKDRKFNGDIEHSFFWDNAISPSTSMINIFGETEESVALNITNGMKFQQNKGGGVLGLQNLKNTPTLVLRLHTLLVDDFSFVPDVTVDPGRGLINVVENPSHYEETETNIHLQVSNCQFAHVFGGRFFSHYSKSERLSSYSFDSSLFHNFTTTARLNGAVMEMKNANHLSLTKVNFKDTRFEGNSVHSNGEDIQIGGCISAQYATIKITDSVFLDNYAQNAGALYCDSSSVDIEGNTQFISNLAESEGGALYISNPEHFIVNGDTIFEYNQAGQSGGAIFFSNSQYGKSSTIKLTDTSTKFQRNHAQYGGAMTFFGVSRTLVTAPVIGCEVSLNVAQVAGGGIYWTFNKGLTQRMAPSVTKNLAGCGDNMITSPASFTLLKKEFLCSELKSEEYSCVLDGIQWNDFYNQKMNFDTLLDFNFDVQEGLQKWTKSVYSHSTNQSVFTIQSTQSVGSKIDCDMIFGNQKESIVLKLSGKIEPQKPSDGKVSIATVFFGFVGGIITIIILMICVVSCVAIVIALIVGINYFFHRVQSKDLFEMNPYGEL